MRSWTSKSVSDNGKVAFPANGRWVKASPSLTVINYEVTVVTGDVRAGGTNANVSCQLYGEEGKTEVLALKSRSNNFERGTTEIFKVGRTPQESRV